MTRHGSGVMARKKSPLEKLGHSVENIRRASLWPRVFHFFKGNGILLVPDYLYSVFFDIALIKEL